MYVTEADYHGSREWEVWVWNGSIEASSRGKLSTAKFSMIKLRMGMHATRWMGQKVLVDCHVNSQAPKVQC
jgi:hypothetical protein